MSAPVLDNYGRALVFDRVTGEVSTHSVPTAIENVRLGRGRYVHGDKGERMDGPAEPEAPADEPVIELKEEGVLDLPPAEVEAHAEATAATFHPLDHDKNGRKGGGPVPRRGRAGAKK